MHLYLLKKEYKMVYNLTFIGAGPATNFAVLKLLEQGYKGNILIIEKGESLETRPKNEVIEGYFGAGAFSDFKLSSSLDVGGVIPNLIEEKLQEYNKYILDKLNEFNEDEKVKWDTISDYDTSNTTLKWNTHNTCHIGTDRGQKICKRIEDFIKSQPNIEIIYKREVRNIFKIDNIFELHLIGGGWYSGTVKIYTKKVILATGQKNLLPSKVMEAFNLESTPRAFQLGVRVEDIMNDKYEEIIKANYDFKFEKKYPYKDGSSIRVRTFCCNSGNAYVVDEKAKEGFICFNGHSYKEPNPNNNTVNYGIMCEIEGLEKYDSKEKQILLMKYINQSSNWFDDNYILEDKEWVVKPTTPLLESESDTFPCSTGIRYLSYLYPKEVVGAMGDFVNELNKIVPLDNATYLYPEVKLSGYTPELNFNTYETKEPGLYMIGDCVISRGIVKAAITGLMFAENLIEGE